MLLLVCAIAVGAVVPFQTAINTRLRASVGSPVVTAMYSFVIATSMVWLIAWVHTSQVLPDFGLLRGQPWWLWLGGFMGVGFIVGNILLFPRIGSVQTVVLPILGQTIMGLVIDALGLFQLPVVPVTPLRLLGAVIVLGGVLLVLGIGSTLRSSGDAGGLASWAWRVFGVAIGMGSATQTAVNGRLGQVLASTTQAAFISLAVGLVLLMVLSLGHLRDMRVAPVAADGPWWMWLGGVLGGFFVIGGATLAPIIGTGTMVIASLSGAMIAGQVVETRGYFGLPATRMDTRRALGLLAIVLGVMMVRLL